MFIQTEDTPNPHSLKFLPGCEVYTGGGAFFEQGDDTDHAPLAAKLLHSPGIKAVFFGRDFITVTKAEDQDWILLKAELLGLIMEHFVAGQPVILTDHKAENTPTHTSSTQPAGEEGEIIKQIKELLDLRVRPAVAQDGGDIIFHRFEEGVVYLTLQGACAGCPASSVTLKQGIENMLKHYIPEIVAVEQVT